MEILIYVPRLTPRINYTFRQVCGRILGLRINFTTKIETFIAHKGVKFSYANQRLGNEVYIQSFGLLGEQGVSDMEVTVNEWEGQPYFFKTSLQSDIPYDIFSASFYLLTRYEEYLPHVKNENGDYPAKESLGYKNDFLTKPIINIWMIKFSEVLLKKFEELNLNLPENKFQVNIAVKQAFKYRKLGISRNFVGFLNNFIRFKLKDVALRVKTWVNPKLDPYDIYDDLVKFKKDNKINMDFMFQLGDYSLYTKNVNYRKRVYKKLIKSMGDYCEIGLLPSYEAIKNNGQLIKEIKRFEHIANHELKSIMIKDQSINFPEFYINLDKTEIVKDFSMGYYNFVGFRAGTCTPYLFYDLNLEQASPIEIRPHFLSSKSYNTSDESEILKSIEENKFANTKYIFLFDNSDFEYSNDKERIFSFLKKVINVSR